MAKSHALKRASKPPARVTPWLARDAKPSLSEAQDRLFTRLAFGLIAAFAVALAWVIAGPHRIGDAFTETDFYGAYAEGARLIQHGHVDPRRYGVIGPGYEVMLALFGLPFPNLFTAAEVLSLLSVVGACLAWFALLRRRVDARLGLAACAFLVVNSTFFRYGFSATTDAFALALQALTLWLLLARAGVRSAVLAGAVAALAFLTRYNAIYLLPAGCLAIGLGGTSHQPRNRALLAFLIGFFAPVVPWVVFSLAHGGVLGVQLHHNIAYDVFAKSRGIPWDRYQEQMQSQFPTLASVIARDPGAVFAREAFNVWDHLRRDAAELLGWPVAWCALLGLVFALRDGMWRKLWPVALAGALLFLTLVPAFYSARYSLPLVPIHAAFEGWLFASPTLALVLSRARGVWLKPALALIPLTLSLRTSVNDQRHYFTQLPYEVLESARTLHEQGKPGDRIIARKPHIGFHSGLELVPFPFTKTLPDLGRYAREKNARWIYFSWLEAELRPEYVYLLDTTAVVPGLTVRHATFGHPSVLYEIGPELGIEPGWLHNDTLVAIHQLRSQLLIHSTNVEALYQLATIERLRGNFDQAFQLMDRATQLAPNDPRFWLLLGDIRLRLHDPVSADAAFVRALTLDPSNAEAQIGRGWASLYANRPRDAAELWRPVVAATHDPTTLQQMIILYGQLGDAASQGAARATLARLTGGR